MIASGLESQGYVPAAGKVFRFTDGFLRPFIDHLLGAVLRTT
jgi:hypothetical protein